MLITFSEHATGILSPGCLVCPLSTPTQLQCAAQPVLQGGAMWEPMGGSQSHHPGIPMVRRRPALSHLHRWNSHQLGLRAKNQNHHRPHSWPVSWLLTYRAPNITHLYRDHSWNFLYCFNCSKTCSETDCLPRSALLLPQSEILCPPMFPSPIPQACFCACPPDSGAQTLSK